MWKHARDILVSEKCKSQDSMNKYKHLYVHSNSLKENVQHISSSEYPHEK